MKANYAIDAYRPGLTGRSDAGRHGSRNRAGGDRPDQATEPASETRFRRLLLIESTGVTQGAMMDRVIRECRKLEQRRVKTSLSARLPEA